MLCITFIALFIGVIKLSIINTCSKNHTVPKTILRLCLQCMFYKIYIISILCGHILYEVLYIIFYWLSLIPFDSKRSYNCSTNPWLISDTYCRYQPNASNCLVLIHDIKQVTQRSLICCKSKPSIDVSYECLILMMWINPAPSE